MKRGLIFTVMLVFVLALGFAQTALSGTYRYNENYYITFTGNNFTGAYGRGSIMSGNYTVSGSRLTLNITGGTQARNTWNWTIVDANTLRDHDGDSWRKENGNSQTPAQQQLPVTNDSLDGTTWKGNDGSILKFNNPNFTVMVDRYMIRGSYVISGNTVTMVMEDDDLILTGPLVGNTLVLTADDGDRMRFTKQ